MGKELEEIESNVDDEEMSELNCETRVQWPPSDVDGLERSEDD